MANTTKSAFLSLALALLILATTLPETNGLLINGQIVNVLAVVGTAHCSPTVTGACNTPCSPLSNLTVAVGLNGNTIAAANTTLNGSFAINITVGNIITGLTDISNLRVFVKLPIADCPIWANVSTGQLVGTTVLRASNIVNGVASLPVTALNLVR